MLCKFLFSGRDFTPSNLRPQTITLQPMAPLRQYPQALATGCPMA
jgi:hypothetical protein